jgi:outer membrane protein
MLRRTLIRSVLYSAFILSAGFLHAQKMLTLEEAIATALQNNYNIQLSKNDSMVAALDYSYRNAVFLPRLNASTGTSWTDNHQNQKFSSGTERKGDVKSNNINASLNLNWTLFDGMKMFATRDKAEEFIRLGELNIKAEINNTVASIVNTYFNIVRQKQQLKAIEEQMSISQVRVDLSQRKLDIGVGAKPDVLQSKVDLNAQKAAQLRQKTLISQLKESLNQLMNVEANTGYDVIETIPINTSITLGEIQADLESKNPSLQIIKKNLDIANLTLKERKADKLPTVSFNSAYNYNRNANSVAVNPALPISNRNNGFNYGFTAAIPIFNNGNNNRLIKQATLNINYQQLVYNNQKSMLHLSVLNAFKDYELQKQSLELEEANILLARENVTILMETYRLGSITYLQLREAQKSLEDAYNRLITVRYNTKLAETELLRLKADIIK